MVVNEKVLNEWLKAKSEDCTKNLKHLYSLHLDDPETKAKIREERKVQDVLLELKEYLEKF